ncbi:MAG TPA: hypothetical protein VE053_01110 [Allosphingosinicella sp.]|nr:hypothetical protein [Allosphingosinicella sp.]
MPPITCLVPAQPGTYVLLGTLDADQFIVTKINVVAWATAGDVLVPVTVAGANHGQEHRLAVLQPDGIVEEADGGVFTSQDEWRRVAVKRARAAEIA